MKSSQKTFTIVIMWISAMLMMGMIATNNPSMGAGATILSIFLLVSVTAGTIAISQTGVSGEGERERPSGSSKVKNSDTALMERLIDNMSEDELAALRNRLGSGVTVGDDGELVEMRRRR
jgi:hypothetical protein